MRPNWKDAPEWAQWLAQDEDGCWYWYQKKPKAFGEGCWERLTIEHFIDIASYPTFPNWQDTLEQRPEQ
ncbi:MAG TPA: hypothetical protein VMZ04_03410 [Anaerolineae bacterium]|nr:hypothetical protein [Anaerolineae bacterium]